MRVCTQVFLRDNHNKYNCPVFTVDDHYETQEIIPCFPRGEGDCLTVSVKFKDGTQIDFINSSVRSIVWEEK